MEHGTYQVPVDYVVTTDDGRKLALGAWLQVQGSRLTEYSRSKPQWYSDIMDLIETGKLWFDADTKRTSPILESFVLASPSSKGTASSVAKSKPASDAQKPTTSRAAPPVQSRDYAMDVDSSDDGSDNSMAQDVKRTRSSSPASAKSQPSAASRPSQPTPSVPSHQKKTSQSSSSDKVTIPVIPEVGAKRRGRPSSLKSSGTEKAVTKRLTKPKASASHKRRKAHKGSSDEESESESASESESSAFSEGSMDWEKYAEGDYSPTEPDPPPEPASRAKATSSSARSSAVTSGSSSKAPSMTAPTLSKTTSSSTAASSSTAEQNKSIRTSHSAFAAAVNKEREHNAAQKLHAQQASHRTPEPSNKPLVQPTQTASKPKSVTSSADRAAVLTSNLPIIPPVPPVIPVPSAATSIGANGRGLELPVSSDAGLIRPEQCLTTATGPLPPRRTLSKPKPVLAPAPTPPPPPVLTSRAATSSASSVRSVAAPSSSTAQSTRSVLPTVSSGALPHIATAPVITEVSSALSSIDIPFIEKVRLMKQQKERSAAAHESPRSDVSVAGSDPPVLTEGISELTADSTSTPATAKNGYPSPRDTYSGADGAKKRCSISEHKQSSSAPKDSSTAPYQLLSREAAQAKDSPRTATGTASDSSGSPTPDLLPGNTEALETDEKGRSDGQQQETEDEKEGDQEEDEESTVVVKGGRRGRLVHGTPRRIDDFGSQLSQHSDPAVPAPTVPVIPTTAEPTPTSRHDLEIISVDDSTTVGNVSLSATQARGVNSIGDVIASAGRERAPSVLTINSDITFNDNFHEDTETSSDEDEETQGGNHRSGAQQASRQSVHRDLYSTPPVSGVSDSACTTGATTNTTLTSSNPPSTTVLATSGTTPSTALVYTLQMSDSEDESIASVEESTNNRTKLPREDEGYVEPNAEFVAFAYTRSSTGPQYPMLGIGMVCNADDDNSNSGLYLIVMVPEGSNDPVRAEYRMDPDEFITVQRGLVLARDLSFVGGKKYNLCFQIGSSTRGN